MKNSNCLMALAAATLTVLASCNEKKASNPTIITTDYEIPQPQAPIKMEAVSNQENVEWLERNYLVTIDRTPADSLSKVKDEYGQEYVPNSIRLTITRPDGSEFFNRLFTKASFVSYLPEDYKRDGILTDMRLYETDSQKLTFFVCHNFPNGTDDELCILELSVDTDGNTAIRRNEGYDMRGNWDNGNDM